MSSNKNKQEKFFDQPPESEAKPTNNRPIKREIASKALNSFLTPEIPPHGRPEELITPTDEDLAEMYEPLDPVDESSTEVQGESVEHKQDFNSIDEILKYFNIDESEYDKLLNSHYSPFQALVSLKKIPFDVIHSYFFNSSTKEPVVDLESTAVDISSRRDDLLSALDSYSHASKLDGHMSHLSPYSKESKEYDQKRYDSNEKGDTKMKLAIGYQEMLNAGLSEQEVDQIFKQERDKFKDTYVGPNNEYMRRKFRRDMRK